MKKISKKQIIGLFLISLLGSFVGIIHGVFFDLNFKEIGRLSLEGFLLTLLVVFPFLLLLEWLFDLNNFEEFRILEGRIKSLEKKHS
jgi:hypothetical protein